VVEEGLVDPEVHLARLLGANKTFIERHVPRVGQMLQAELTDVVAASEVIVLGSNDPQAIEALAACVRSDQLVIDLVGLTPERLAGARVEGLCWRA
jgi:GDP-mannose 6-dehydrogenase